MQETTGITPHPEKRKTLTTESVTNPKKPLPIEWTLKRPVEKTGAEGKGGKDFSHTKSGRLVRESVSANRARNRGKK